MRRTALLFALSATVSLFADGYEPEDMPPFMKKRYFPESAVAKREKKRPEKLSPSLEKLGKTVSSYDMRSGRFEKGKEEDVRPSPPIERKGSPERPAKMKEPKKKMPARVSPKILLADGFTEKFFLKKCEEEGRCHSKPEKREKVSVSFPYVNGKTVCDPESSICLTYEKERTEENMEYTGYVNVNGKRTAVLRLGNRTIYASEGTAVDGFVVSSVSPFRVLLKNEKTGDVKSLPFSGS